MTYWCRIPESPRLGGYDLSIVERVCSYEYRVVEDVMPCVDMVIDGVLVG
jgi:hypothetical protein